MKAISLWRPWPWTFFNAGKRVENRSWKPPASIIGELVAMHAAQKWDRSASHSMAEGELGAAARHVPSDHIHSTGIVGVFRITGAFHIDQLGNPMLGAPPNPVWAFGPWCWTVTDVVQLRHPIPYRGRQGLWNLEPNLAATLLDEIEAVG